MSPDEKTELKLNIGKIPEILLDNTDRNRTSPFAFTGNKFEFRAVGSSANCASAMTVINAIVANQLVEFKKEVDGLMEKDVKKDEAIFQVLKKYITTSKNIRFEGNGYSEEWVKEAKRRKLNNITTTPTALDAFVSKSSKKLFTAFDILSEREIEARHDIQLETYSKKIQIESRIIGDLAVNHVIPTAVKYQNTLIENVKGLKDIYTADEYKKLAATQLQMIREISEHISLIKTNVDKMIEARKKANKLTSAKEHAVEYCDKVVPFFDVIRYNADKLELLVDDELWTLPKYRELLFNR